MIVYGKQIFNYIVKNHSDLINEVILSKNIDKKLFFELKKLGVTIKNTDEKKAQALAKGGNHQGYFLDIKNNILSDIFLIKDFKFLVVLVGITDMGNIGSIIRSSYSLGADGVVISGIGDIKLSNIVRSSSGAAVSSYVASYKNIDDLINRLKSYNFKIYSLDLDGKNINNFKDSNKKIAILLGNEAEGLPARVVKKSDEVFTIPMSGRFDSLNVSNAAAISINRMLNG